MAMATCQCGARGILRPDFTVPGCRCRSLADRAGATETARKPAAGPAARPAPAKHRRRGGGPAQDALKRALDDEGFCDVLDVLGSDGPMGFEKLYVRELHWAVDVPRDFRADFGFPTARLLVELVGGAHLAGRKKMDADCRREALAASLGWRLLRVSHEMVRDGSAAQMVLRAISATE